MRVDLSPEAILWEAPDEFRCDACGWWGPAKPPMRWTFAMAPGGRLCLLCEKCLKAESDPSPSERSTDGS